MSSCIEHRASVDTTSFWLKPLLLAALQDMVGHSTFVQANATKLSILLLQPLTTIVENNLRMAAYTLSAGMGMIIQSSTFLSS